MKYRIIIRLELNKKKDFYGIIKKKDEKEGGVLNERDISCFR